MSFCDAKKPRGSQFLGVVITQGVDIVDAVRRAHAFGCNPGGEVVGVDCGVYASPVPPQYCDRLLTRTEAEEADTAARIIP